jgi:putative ABC transport system substrate-binding protein
MRGHPMKRREFIAVLGGSASAWPLPLSAQQPERMRRIGVLIALIENDPESKRRVEALVQALRELGWIDGRNVRFDYRFAGGDIERMRAYAAEVVELAPDVILVQSNPFLVALRQTNRTIPTVFAVVADPVGGGFVESLARPGGNLTGFTVFEAEIGGKWLEALKEIAPRVSRTLVLLHPETAANVAFLRAAEAVAPSLRMTVTEAGVHNAAEIERAIAAFAGEPDGGLVVCPHPITGVNRDLIAGLAARYGLPAVWPFRFFMATNGGLMSYGVDVVDLFRRAAVYVDRILRGAKPGDLPVQNPIKYELVINLKTAKALGLTVPPTLLARADELIE